MTSSQSTPQPNGDHPSRPIGDDPARLDLGDPHTVELLARFDEIEPGERATLAADPAASRLLARLEEVDGMLEVVRRTPVEVSADELYDFGGGPGATALTEERRGEIEAYLAEHPGEAAWVDGLSAGVPVPLDFASDTDATAGPALRALPPLDLAGDTSDSDGQPVTEAHGTVPRRAPAWVVWAPLAAAALVLAMALGGTTRLNALDGGLPESPVLRSARSEGLLFPRGRVLAASVDQPMYAAQPLFEVARVPGASTYRFELRSGTGGAFGEGQAVWNAASTAPFATAPALTAGTYSWSAWAVTNNVERPLGTLDFTVVPGPLSHYAGVGAESAASTREDVRVLHAAGYLTDARFRARSLPAGPARAKYLAVR